MNKLIKGFEDFAVLPNGRMCFPVKQENGEYELETAVWDLTKTLQDQSDELKEFLWEIILKGKEE
jgi:hypothetical protein